MASSDQAFPWAYINQISVKNNAKMSKDAQSLSKRSKFFDLKENQGKVFNLNFVKKGKSVKFF